MAEFKLVGVSTSSGEYEGHRYDNTNLHVTYKTDKVGGEAVKVVKVKTSIYTSNPLKIGEFFDVNYDQYGKVKQLLKG